MRNISDKSFPVGFQGLQRFDFFLLDLCPLLHFLFNSIEQWLVAPGQGFPIRNRALGPPDDFIDQFDAPVNKMVQDELDGKEGKQTYG